MDRGKGRMKFGWMVMTLGLMLVTPGWAQENQTVTCQQVRQQLQGMQEAQAALLKSFVSKNLAMAETLDEHAKRLKKSDKRSKQVKSLRDSADSFREHHQREAKLIARFEQASREVLQLAAKCIPTQKLDQVADQFVQNSAKLGQR